MYIFFVSFNLGIGTRRCSSEGFMGHRLEVDDSEGTRRAIAESLRGHRLEFSDSEGMIDLKPGDIFVFR